MEAAKDVELKPPSGVNWWSYFMNVGKISPVPKDLPFGKIPEGVIMIVMIYLLSLLPRRQILATMTTTL